MGPSPTQKETVWPSLHGQTILLRHDAYRLEQALTVSLIDKHHGREKVVWSYETYHHTVDM